MKALRLPPLSAEALAELDRLYHTTHAVRLRTRAHIVLLATEQQLVARDIAAIVRQDEATVRRWRTRYHAEGVNGLRAAPRSGAPATVTAEYTARLLASVRHRPRSLGQPSSLWTLQRRADERAEATGIRVEAETVRAHVQAAEIVLSRPHHTISSPDPEYQVNKRRLQPPATS